MRFIDRQSLSFLRVFISLRNLSADFRVDNELLLNVLESPKQKNRKKKKSFQGVQSQLIDPTKL